MDPASIPRAQSQRVALYQQQFGPFDSGKNAYWSLRKGRPVTLAEGAQFDIARNGAPLRQAVRAVPVYSTTGAGAFRQKREYTTGPPLPGDFAPVRIREKAAPITMPKTFARLIDATKATGMDMRWKGARVFTTPQERTAHMPTEAQRVAALPSSPRPGPAQPPKEPLFDAIMRQLQEQRVGPTGSAPAFAAPTRAFADARAATPMVAAGFDVKQLALPLAIVVGAYVVSQLT